MVTPKPSIGLPQWATTPESGALIEPPTGKKDTGHQFVTTVDGTFGEKPRMGYENWLKNPTYEWLNYLFAVRNLEGRVSALETDTILPNESVVFTALETRIVTISDTVVDNDFIEIKDGAGTASETAPIIINAPAGFTFEEGSTDAEMQIPRATFTFRVLGTTLYLV